MNTETLSIRLNTETKDRLEQLAAPARRNLTEIHDWITADPPERILELCNPVVPHHPFTLCHDVHK